MLKAREVRTILGISSDTLLKLIKAGEFPGAMKAGAQPNGHWRIPEKSLDDYLKRNAFRPSEEAAARS